MRPHFEGAESSLARRLNVVYKTPSLLMPAPLMDDVGAAVALAPQRQEHAAGVPRRAFGNSRDEWSNPIGGWPAGTPPWPRAKRSKEGSQLASSPRMLDRPCAKAAALQASQARSPSVGRWKALGKEASFVFAGQVVAGRRNWSNRLWALLFLEMWFREFID